MILAGDIGGTNARLALFSQQPHAHPSGQLTCVVSQVYPSQSAQQFESIMMEFLQRHPAEVTSCCLGIAGPITDNHCHATNLPWDLDARALQQHCHIEQVTLINDLVANAYGINALGQDDLLTLNPGNAQASGNRAVISAGTGLGEAGLFWDDHQYHPFATEGGHCDFGPRTEQQYQLAAYLQQKLGHVSYETILSGDGLVQVYDFILQHSDTAQPEWLQQQMDEQGAAASISTAAVNGSFHPCKEALDLFLEIYGQEAGNLALKVMARGGVYLGGGIAAKLASSLKQSARFLQGFRNKDKMTHLMQDIPIHIILNQDTALLGAANLAAQQVKAS